MSSLNHPSPPKRPVTANQCYLAYGTALFVGIVAWLAITTFQLIDNIFWIGLVVTVICTCTIWIFSIANGNSSIYDPYWVIAPPFIAIALKATGGGGLFGPWTMRQIFIISCLFIWSSRYHIFYKWSGWRTGLVHEDWRYEQMRSLPLPYWLNSLTGMHLFPTVLVYFAFAPAALVLSHNPVSQLGFNSLDILGVVGALTAVVIQLAADEQLRRFRLTSQYNEGDTFRGGLWNYSRHPNYFGEVLFWLSMVPFSVAAGMLSENPILVWAGPLVMALFFRFSAWLMDVRSLKRRPDYQQVLDQVSPMVPWFPKK